MKLKHVAIIPDGNRRWAKAKGLEPWIGHQVGAENARRILEEAKELEIPYFTLWIASLDNLIKRPKLEVDFLCQVFADYFTRLSREPEVHKNEVRIRAYGLLEEVFPQDVVAAVREAEKKTASYGRHHLSFLMGYDGQVEMIKAVEKIVAKALVANPHPKPVTKELILENLWTSDLPPVDLLIRTGTDDEPHWSGGLLMWQTAYSQFYFTNTYFPEFSKEEFRKAVQDYEKRERRLGA
jgi:undecaprenyl diphosphate synthase